MRCPRCGTEGPDSGLCSSCQSSPTEAATSGLTASPDSPTGFSTRFSPGDTARTTSAGVNAATDDDTGTSEWPIVDRPARPAGPPARPVKAAGSFGSSGRLRRRRSAQARPVLRPPLSHHPAARHRRHGRGLPGLGRGARRRRRDQGHPAGGHGRPAAGRRSRAALQARAAARAAGHAQERRPHSRPRRDRRHQVHHDVVRRRHRPGDAAQERGQAQGSRR